MKHEICQTAKALPWALILVLGALFCPGVSGSDGMDRLAEIAEERGGLAVVVGQVKPADASRFLDNRDWLMEVLVSDGAQVALLRRAFQRAGLHGRATVRGRHGPELPYVSNTVNVLLTQRGDVPEAEIRRVLVPGGTALLRGDAGWKSIQKRWPPEIDEWTHYLHGADGNAVARDDVVGPPRHLQWLADPRWSRHHDRVSSVNACVSANGRLFTIVDEGSRASIMLPAHWKLVARDAFNGKTLWKRDLNWISHLWGLKSGPAQVPRLLVAVEDEVYVPTDLAGPVRALDAATGEALRTYPGSANAEELLVAKGKLVALVRAAEHPVLDYNPIPAERAGQGATKGGKRGPKWEEDRTNRFLRVYDLDSATLLWERPARVLPLSMAAGEDRLVWHDGECMVCADLADGSQQWRSEPVYRKQGFTLPLGACTIVHEGRVYFAAGLDKGPPETGPDNLFALDLSDGRIIWCARAHNSVYLCPENLYVIDGLLWTGSISFYTKSTGVFSGYDPATGEKVREFLPDVQSGWFHHRCYRTKATRRYIITARAGSEFVDVRNEHWDLNHWVRGPCLYGVLPANGLLYAPPHACACLTESRLAGFYALAAEGARRQALRSTATEERLERGRSFERPSPRTARRSDDWPTYRHDQSRTGRAGCEAPTTPRLNWETELGGELPAPVIAGGTCYVADGAGQTLYALDASTGAERWRYPAGGRIDSPPSVRGDLVLFGSRDGWVNCLSAKDGSLRWRFRTAPADRHALVCDRVESVWPVHGTVTLVGDEVHAVAGRSRFLDGGLRYVRLDAQTGELLGETVMDEKNAEGQNWHLRTDRKVNYANGLPVALPDVLVRQGDRVFMRSQAFDLEGNLLDESGAHLFSPVGLLDDSWFHRAYWIYGSGFGNGPWGWPRAAHRHPAGRILAIGAEKVYGYARTQEHIGWITPLTYHLFRCPQNPKTHKIEVKQKVGGISETGIVFDWSRSIPLHVYGLALAGDSLVCAGAPNMVNEEEAFRGYSDPAVGRQLKMQDAAMDGARGGLLYIVSATDGAERCRIELDTVPVWDGLAVAGGRIYMSAGDGRVMCYCE